MKIADQKFYAIRRGHVHLRDARYLTAAYQNEDLSYNLECSVWNFSKHMAGHYSIDMATEIAMCATEGPIYIEERDW